MERKVILTKQAFSSKQSRSARALLVQNFRQEKIDCDFIISNTLNMIGKIKEFEINDQHFVYFFTVNGFVKNLLDYQYGIVLLFVRLALAIYINFTVVMSGESSVCHKLVFDFLKKNFNEATALKIYGGSNKKLLKSNEPASDLETIVRNYLSADAIANKKRKLELNKGVGAQRVDADKSKEVAVRSKKASSSSDTSSDSSSDEECIVANKIVQSMKKATNAPYAAKVENNSSDDSDTESSDGEAASKKIAVQQVPSLPGALASKSPGMKETNKVLNGSSVKKVAALNVSKALLLKRQMMAKQGESSDSSSSDSSDDETTVNTTAALNQKGKINMVAKKAVSKAEEESSSDESDVQTTPIKKAFVALKKPENLKSTPNKEEVKKLNKQQTHQLVVGKFNKAAMIQKAGKKVAASSDSSSSESSSSDEAAPLNKKSLNTVVQKKLPLHNKKDTSSSTDSSSSEDVETLKSVDQKAIALTSKTKAETDSSSESDSSSENPPPAKKQKQLNNRGIEPKHPPTVAGKNIFGKKEQSSDSDSTTSSSSEEEVELKKEVKMIPMISRIAALSSSAVQKAASSSESDTSTSSEDDLAAAKPITKKTTQSVVSSTLQNPKKTVRKSDTDTSDSSSSGDMDFIDQVTKDKAILSAAAFQTKKKLASVQKEEVSDSESKSSSDDSSSDDELVNSRSQEKAGILKKKASSSSGSSSTTSSEEEKAEKSKESKNKTTLLHLEKMNSLPRSAKVAPPAVKLTQVLMQKADDSSSSDDDVQENAKTTGKITAVAKGGGKSVPGLVNSKKRVRDDVSSSSDSDEEKLHESQAKKQKIQPSSLSSSHAQKKEETSDSSSTDSEKVELSNLKSKIITPMKHAKKNTNEKKMSSDSETSSSDEEETQAVKQQQQAAASSSSSVRKKEATSDSSTSSDDLELMNLSDLKLKTSTPKIMQMKPRPLLFAAQSSGEKSLSKGDDSGKVLKKKRPAASDEMNKSFNKSQNDQSEKKKKKMNESGNTTNGRRNIEYFASCVFFSLKKPSPFRRVSASKNDLDEPFRDNSFKSKYDEWGKKAYETFSTVKGKSFRKEKTKKKRGTYRGGRIDPNLISKVEEILNDPPLLERFDEPSPNCSPIPDALVQIAPKELGTVADGRWSEDHIKFVLIALVEMVCCLTESNPEKQKKLFCVLSQTLVELGLIPPLLISNELYSIRQQFFLSMAHLLEKAQCFLDPNKSIKMLENRSTSFPELGEKSVAALNENKNNITISRYRIDFVEICQLGKGGFGQVVKALNKLDDQFYAVKKIEFSVLSPEQCLKLLGEVRFLARLNHPNVVRYHCAWLEFDPQAVESLPTSPESLKIRELQDVSPTTLTTNDDDNKRGTFFPTLSSLRLPRSRSSPEIVFASTSGQSFPPKLLENSPSQASCSLSSSSSSKSSSLSCSGSEMNFAKKLKKSKKIPKALKLYLQMELCSWTLKDWMDERNAAVKSNCCNLLYANYRKTKTSPFDLVNADVNEIILRQLVEAIQYIHSQNVMHRDLKPSNVFLSGQKPQVLLGDFGLACQFLSPEIWSEQENNNFTKVEQQPQPTKQHSKAIGTSLYASPEQLKLSTYDNKTDMYSFGIIVYEMYFPFQTAMERAVHIGRLRQQSIAEDFQQKWPVIAGIVSQLIQQQPALRPSAAELIRSGLFKSEQDTIHALREENAKLLRQLAMLEVRLQRCPLAILPEADVPALRNAVSIRPENIVQSIKAPNVRHTYAICRCAYKPTVIFF
ncbi:Eukaryotic translation initiation factor 2-alpha kinase 1 [Trichinella patagoniensis]|uniref:Eukaryotic translation initiation factor 2-alpha kinase 1 n=1 Tax=Trichinella patagoniensis TaxID=990121 RepID=A0A0V0ZTH6_9BILA|nr:Eukaryotic translation initiation factor 2-alpha kinase 1 [Trichinella patagoniensis]